MLACLVVGIVPGADRSARSSTCRGASGARRARRPTYSLAVWHGFNLPLLMSLIALAGGVAALPGRCSDYLRARRSRARRCSAGSTASASSSASLVALSLALARARSSGCSARAACSRSCGCWSCVALLAAALAALRARPRPGRPCALPASIRRSRWSGLVGAACALGAAWQAKFHRLAALILLGGAGLVTCLTFVWFSAPDLALTQLLVEVVTTVLLLLGLRWLPKRFERSPARAPSALAHGCGALRDLAHRRRRRRRHGRARLRGDDAAAARHASRSFFLEHAYPKAAAPTSST